MGLSSGLALYISAKSEGAERSALTRKMTRMYRRMTLSPPRKAQESRVVSELTSTGKVELSFALGDSSVRRGRSEFMSV